jgi:hypothetical protein
MSEVNNVTWLNRAMWHGKNYETAVLSESPDSKGYILREDSGPYGGSTTFMAKRYGDRPLITSFDAAKFWAHGVLKRLWNC